LRWLGGRRRGRYVLKGGKGGMEDKWW